jgi:ABC-2 type transport system ATP-binding protein
VHEIVTRELRKVFRRVTARAGTRDAARVARGAPAVIAVDRVDIAVARGEIYGFLGPNGAGKTTTIKMILGLITPSAGRVEIPNGLRTRDGRLRLGAVLEGNRNIYYRMTAVENLWYYGILRGMKPVDVRKRTEELLTFLDLTDKRNAPSQTLSRGMQQKLAIACALVHDPEILLLDEPTLGLDVATARAIQVKLTELAHRQGKTILLTTHQMDLAQAVSDRVGIINKGRIVAEDTVERLTGLFKRLSYSFEVPTGDIERAKIALVKFEYTAIDARRPGKSLFTVQVAEKRGVFALMRALEANGVVPESLAESIPKLEDVFISFTTGERIGDSAGGNARKDARSDSKANAAREGENDD